MNFSEKKYVNKTAIMGHTIIDTILFAAYFIEVLKGARTIGYYAVFAVLTMGPIVAEWIVFKKNPESGAIKHMIGITYGILYLFVIFTTTSALPFTYAFPMFIVIILYMDTRFNVLIAVFASVGNVLYIAYHALTVGYTGAEIADVEIRIAATFVAAAFMVLTTVAVTKVNNHKLQQIQEHTDEANRLTDNLLSTSNEMIENISEVTQQMNKLGESVERVHNAMGEVSTGSTETAESVQVQMQRTEQIQNHIGRVKDTAVLIKQNINDTTQKVVTGRAQMDALMEQVD